MLGVAGVAAVLLLQRWMPPDDPRLTVCWLRRVTHHECATCGMTRAMAHLVRGEFAAAAARHPLALPLAAEGALLWLAAPFAMARRWWPSGRQGLVWVYAHVALLLMVWLARLFTRAA